MTYASASAVPPGWYPDPSGARQWRVWTGEQWSELTRPFAPAEHAPSLVASLPLTAALHRLQRYGVVGVYAGLALVVGVLAHWPGTAHPASAAFATTALAAALALLALGLAAVAFVAKELAGRWTPVAFIPGLNVLFVSRALTRRVGGAATRRAVSEAVLLVLYVARFRVDPWLGVAPILLALGLATSAQALLDELATPSGPPPHAP